jgi:hypothetical protein
MGFCHYQYRGLAYPDEAAFAASIALQAYFEGRAITVEDMNRCLEFWKNNISEREDPVRRKRSVCCEPYFVPTPQCTGCYKCTHPERMIPYGDNEATAELKEVYEKYGQERVEQIANYENFTAPVHQSTLCRACGCRRCFGRKGCCFCTEGCTGCDRKAGEPAPPFEVHDFDDDWDASSVLMKMIGPPPPNVVIRRWRWDPEKGENYLDVCPKDTVVLGNKPHEA